VEDEEVRASITRKGKSGDRALEALWKPMVISGRIGRGMIVGGDG